MLSIIEITLALIIGILWGLYLEIKFLIIALIFLYFYVLVFYKKIKFQSLILFVIIIISSIYTKNDIKKFDNKYIDDSTVKMDVIILSHLRESDYTYKYICKSKAGDKFIIYFKKKENTIFKIGDWVSINGTYNLPDVARNKGTFNYRRYLNSNNIYGTILVESYENSNGEKSFLSIVYNIQNIIHDNFQKVLSKEYAGLLSGMLVGETTDISDKTTDNFRSSGISHLLAVSGSNVALIIAFSNLIIIKMFGKRYSDFISIVFVIFFVLISGASPSVLRAGIMAILNITANIISRKSDSITNLISSAFFILIANPLAILNVGFLLSFAGTVGILIFSTEMKNFISKYIKIDFISENISLNFSAQIIILPINLYFFNSISIIGFVANLFIVPVTSILTFLGILLLVITFVSIKWAKILIVLVNPILKYIIVMSEFFSKFDFLNLSLPKPSPIIIIIFYLLLFLEYDNYINKKQIYLIRISNMSRSNLNRRIKKYVYVIFIALIVISSTIKAFPKRYVELTAIDVGQGDSFLMVSKNGTRILIDGGGSETSDYDVGQNILMPYLLSRGYMKIDYIFVSHAHADHIDGIYTVLNNFKVKKVFISTYLKNDEKIKKLKEIATKNHVKIMNVKEGDFIKIDNIEFKILYPSEDIVDLNINNLSMIIKAKCNNKTILFTGDAETEVEEILLKKYAKEILNADILKVGHHGAKTSSSEAFINAVSPKMSLISVGKDNNYGHPNNGVVERLEKAGKVLMTSKLGETNLRIYDNGKTKIKSKIK